MSKYTRVGLPALLLAIDLDLAFCGGSGSAQQEDTESGGAQEESTSEMAGMDHASMEADPGSVAPRELIVDGEYSDERFIDMMAAHHQMAIEMANVAQQNAELPEIRQIADDIVTTQQEEISNSRRLRRSSSAPLRCQPR